MTTMDDFIRQMMASLKKQPAFQNTVPGRILKTKANLAAIFGVPNVPVKSVGRKKARQDEEHIYQASTRTATCTTAGGFVTASLHDDIDTYILPTGSKYVDEDHKFNLKKGEILVYAESDDRFVVWLLLHVRETGDSALPSQYFAWSNSQTMEEGIEGIVPAGNHDFEIISPAMPARLSGWNGTNPVYLISKRLDVTPILNKISQEYYSSTEHIARKYTMFAIVSTAGSGQNVYFWTPVHIVGRMTLARNRML